MTWHSRTAWTLSFASLLGAGFLNLYATKSESHHVIQLSSKRQLFVDCYLIERMEGVHLTLHQPVKYVGNPILVANRAWENALG
jgi:hypothetical protein